MTTIKASSFTPVMKTMLFITGVITATFLSLVLFSSSAYATGGDGGTIDAGTGTQQPPASGIGTDTPDSPKPGRPRSTGKTLPDGVTNFTMACNNWSGSGSWRPSTNCVTTKTGVPAAAPSPQKGWGTSTAYPGIKFSTYVAYNGKSCAPSGAKSAHSQTWQQIVSDYVETDYDYRWYKHSGWIKIQLSTTLKGQYVSYYPLGCVYPTDKYTTKICFWNYGGNAKYSIDKNRAISAWAPYGANNGIRPASASDPKTPTGGTGTTAPNCGREGSANVYHKAQTSLLGYYRMHVTYDYRTYTKLSWMKGGTELYGQWTRGSVLSGSQTTYWTHACRPNTPNATQGPYNSQAAIPNVDQYTNPATCPQVTWQCVLGTPSTVGLDRTAVLNGSTNSRSVATVMRNGEKIPVDWSRVQVVDTSTPVNLDATNGQVTPGVRNITNIAYKNVVKAGSTPFFGTDPNATNQYFKLYQVRDGSTKEKFGVWINNNNSNLSQAVSFNWASESSTKPFAMQRTYRVTGEFNTPLGGSVGGSAPGASQGTSWKVGTYDCRDYSGRGASRVDRGILTATTNNIAVSRATGK